MRVLALMFCATVTSLALAQAAPEEVTFPSGDLNLHGQVWKPAGEGPFATVIWNHGSDQNPRPPTKLAEFYTSHGYVFFTPQRRGHGRSPGPYFADQVGRSPFSRSTRMVELLVEQNADVVAAVAYMKSQPYVDPERIAVSGCSFGGIETLLTGEHAIGVKALIPFAPGAMSWADSPALQIRLKRAVDQAKAPIFVIQAANDYNVAPSHELTREAQAHHTDFRAKVYPPYGDTPQDGHGKFCGLGMDVWGKDVLAFLDAHL
jgi:dienelactone hydrolase